MDTPKRTSPGKSLRGKVPCKVDGCEALYFCGGYCSTHWERVRRDGHPGEASRRRPPASKEWRRDRDGYVYRSENGKKVLQHRKVMEGVLGRPLKPHEGVHHKNQVRDDNRPENLELTCSVTKSGLRQPGARVEDLVAFVCDEYPEFVEAFMANRAQLRLVS